MLHPYNPSTWEVEAGLKVPGQTKLRSETDSKSNQAIIPVSTKTQIHEKGAFVQIYLRVTAKHTLKYNPTLTLGIQNKGL